MSWSEFDAKPQVPDEAENRLRREVSNALEHGPELLKYLLTMVRGASYAPGRTSDQAAFIEGQRDFARKLLQYGGKIYAEENDQENHEES